MTTPSARLAQLMEARRAGSCDCEYSHTSDTVYLTCSSCLAKIIDAARDEGVYLYFTRERRPVTKPAESLDPAGNEEAC